MGAAWNKAHPERSKLLHKLSKERSRQRAAEWLANTKYHKWAEVASPISNNQRIVPPCSGVYCFYEMFADKATVIYIGQTNNLYFRILTHTKFNHPYDKSLFVKYKACLNPGALEERLIKRLKPSMNQLVDGKIIKVTIQSEAWQEKLRKQREWRASKRSDAVYVDKIRTYMREKKREYAKEYHQTEEYASKKKQRQQELQLHSDWLVSEQGQTVSRKKNAARVLGQYCKKPGYYREKKNLFKVFGTKKDITFPLRKSIALVHLGRRLVRGGWQGGNQLPIDKERVSQIVERINQGETYAAYE